MLVPVSGLLVPWVVSFPKWLADREQRTRASSVGVVLLPLAMVTLALPATLPISLRDLNTADQVACAQRGRQ